MVFGPWHEEDVEEWEGGGDGDFDLPPNGSQLHAQAGISVRPKRKRHAKLDPVVGEKAPQTEEKKAKGAPTRREKPEIGVQTRAAPIPFVLDAAAGGFGATDFLKVRYDYHVVLTQPHANREKKMSAKPRHPWCLYKHQMPTTTTTTMIFSLLPLCLFCLWL